MADTPPHARVARFLADVGAGDDPDAVAAVFAAHLAGIAVDALPPAAHAHWRDIARLLKAPAEKLIPDKAVHAIRSWPAARIAELVALVRAADAVLEKLENERLEDEIRDQIRRHYL